ncbi:hypothetical protein Patl1_24502 [Pistacia atlantica]|uniref:Uncharacterized protein n=1 Tax=Pistacia atlantica TaxID=434234 RepID=A0ACC0ZYM8_9ROSI|nr:hypothetical protein Patl1_24502 [Pistacia atlantica]
MCTISSSHQFFSDISVPRNCKSAVMVEQDWLKTSYLANTNPNVLNEREHVPVVMEFGRHMGSCAPTENNDESGCTGNLFCNITGHNDCSTCPHGYTLNSSRNGDDKPMCDQVSTLSGSPGGPSNTSGIPGGAVGLSSAILSSVIGTLSISIGAQRLYEFKMEQNRLFEILDTRVSKDEKEQEIIKFADLTRRCLDSNGSNKPTMRRVATELAGIRVIDDGGDPPREYPIIHESKIKSLQMKIEKEEDDTAFQVE